MNSVHSGSFVSISGYRKREEKREHETERLRGMFLAPCPLANPIACLPTPLLRSCGESEDMSKSYMLCMLPDFLSKNQVVCVSCHRTPHEDDVHAFHNG